MANEAYSKEERKLRKALGNLICHVRLFEMQTDNLFHSASPITGVERGKALAEYLNQLVMTSDRQLYFALGFDYRKDQKAMRKNGTNFKAIQKLAAKTTRETSG